MDKRQLQIVLKLQDEASRELRKVTGELNNADNSTQKWGNSLAFVAKWAKVAAAAVFAAASAGVAFGVKVASQIETATVGLTTLLGDAEEAAATIERLKIEAARTPFDMPGLARATQLLTSVTKDGDKSIDILLDVGEALAAMGKGQSELDRIIVNLQQIAATGRAATIDVKQFAFAGIPIYEMLQEQTGLAGEALETFIGEGKVSFDLLTEMFDKANDKGGKFFNAFENQSGTFQQEFSNMKDSIGLFFADIVTKSGAFDLLKNGMAGVSNLLGDWDGNMARVKDNLTQFMKTLDEKTLIITHMREAWDQIVQVFNEFLKPALQGLWESFKPFLPFLELFAKFLGGVFLVLIHGLIEAVKFLTIGISVLLGGLAKLSAFMYDVIIVVFDSVKKTVQDLIGFVQNLIDVLKSAWDWAGKVVDKAGGFFNKVGSGISSVFSGRAEGGHVSANQPYVVGERGPEMFIPRSSGVTSL